MYLDTLGGKDRSPTVRHRKGIWPSQSASISTIGGGVYLDNPGRGECSECRTP